MLALMRSPPFLLNGAFGEIITGERDLLDGGDRQFDMLLFELAVLCFGVWRHLRFW